MTKKGYKPPVKRYRVTAEFEDVDIIVSARSEGEARKKVRQRISKGTIKPVLRPSKYTGTGENPCAELAWTQW
jgi:hypothetical protein